MLVGLAFVTSACLAFPIVVSADEVSTTQANWCDDGGHDNGKGNDCPPPPPPPPPPCDVNSSDCCPVYILELDGTTTIVYEPCYPDPCYCDIPCPVYEDAPEATADSTSSDLTTTYYCPCLYEVATPEAAPPEDGIEDPAWIICPMVETV